jgi:glucose-1-phosphatase
MGRMSKTIAGQNFGAILFDLGNVLIDVDFYRCARLWSDHAGIPAETLAARFRIDEAYRAFECGKVDAASYYEALRRQLEINLPDDIMREGWNAVIRDEKSGIRDCLKRLACRYPLYVLTNTNPEHEKIWAEKHRELLSFFKGIFVSSRMGCRKPDAEIYLKVSHTIGIPCSRILFFDDADENVAGARRAGMHAIHADHAHTIPQWLPPLVANPGI